MSQENVEIVRAAFDAWNRGDLEDLFSYLAPDAEFHTTGRFADEGVYRGRAGLARLFSEFRQDLEEQRVSADDVRAVGQDAVIVEAVLTGRGRQSKAGFEERLWYVGRFRDGLVVRIETYVDAAHALQAAGIEE
jgi:ketosteroid isomerase-like protein